jgi:putative flippase GtrA
VSRTAGWMQARWLDGSIREIVVFGAVGLASALAFGICVDLLVTHGVLSRSIASAVCYAALVPLAYVGQRTLAFQSSTAVRVSFQKYVALQAVGFLLTQVMTAVIVARGAQSSIGLWFLVAALAAAGNYFVLKLWVFAAKPSAGSGIDTI